MGNTVCNIFLGVAVNGLMGFIQIFYLPWNGSKNRDRQLWSWTLMIQFAQFVWQASSRAYCKFIHSVDIQRRRQQYADCNILAPMKHAVLRFRPNNAQRSYDIVGEWSIISRPYLTTALQLCSSHSRLHSRIRVR